MPSQDAAVEGAMAGQRLEGRRVLVTGASAGIGAATARAIVVAGGRVALVARSRDRLEDLAGELRELAAARTAEGGGPRGRGTPWNPEDAVGAPGRTTPGVAGDLAGADAPVAVVVDADVVDADAARAAVDAAAEQLGGLDAVVNAAGVARPGPVATTPPADWQLMLDVNVRGLLHVTQAALPHLSAAADRDERGELERAGDIVNVSSMSGRRVASPAMGVYAASKAAVHALSGALRSEVGGDGIRVSVIAPGFVRTGIFEGQDSDAARQLGRTGEEVGLEPEQVADRIVEVLAAPPGLVHVEVAMVSVDQ